MASHFLLSPHIIWVIVPCHVIAIMCTVARLLYRWYIRRFWWEDVWAVIAATWAVICLTGFLLHGPPMGPISYRDRISDWFTTLSYTAVVWTVRFSIFLSLVRVSNPTGSSRYIAFACMAALMIMCIASTAQKIYYCAVYACYVSSPVAIMQLITDVLGDAVLVFAPILFLWDVQLSKNRRVLILSAFSSSILVTAVSITHSVFLLHTLGPITVFLAHVKVFLSLFVCNALVLATFVYRVWHRGKDDGVDLDGPLPFRRTWYLTPIDLGQLTAGTLSTGGDHGTRTYYTRTDTNTHTYAYTYTNSMSISRHDAAQEEGQDAVCPTEMGTGTQPEPGEVHAVPVAVDASPRS